MEPVSHLIKVTLPNYLSNLPIPDSVGGWSKLGARDWVALVPFGAAVAGVTYLTYKSFFSRARCDCEKGPINYGNETDVADFGYTFDIEDFEAQAAFRDCWETQPIPYWDAPGPHNRETGDNVGPVVVKRKEKRHRRRNK